ncbi:MAG: NAD(P)-dependent oxidoreductase [Candidatus Delongbacteria bacterium]|nr:NAD(P)-dependent oxidoreductase [Candidatus Delongbacteria bacterium]
MGRTIYYPHPIDSGCLKGMMVDQSIIITGASGFIGRHIVKLFLEEGWEILAIDYGTPLDDFSDHPRYRHLYGDWLNQGERVFHDLIWIMENNHYPYALHLAWHTQHQDYWTSPLNRDWAGVTCRFIETFYHHGGRRWVGIGSCAEYDPTAPFPWSETHTRLKPESLYGESKLSVLRYLEELAVHQGIDYAWARVFFVYGPFDRGNRLIPYLMQSWSQNEIPRLNYPDLKRDYIFIEDLARQIFWITTHPVNGAVNTGTGKAVPLGEIGRILSQISNNVQKIEIGDTNSSPQSALQPNVIESDIHKLIQSGYSPDLTKLESGLEKTWQWFINKDIDSDHSRF